jgi:transaldolase/glucose-6-phosphate isomerase
MNNPINQALAVGQSIWYDGISRSLLKSGDFERKVKVDGLRGMTSNPSIFEKAIVGSDDYSSAIAELRRSGPLDAKSAYEHLAIVDIQAAADILRTVFDESDGADGYVSMEVSPELANDTALTVAEAKRLWATINRPNLMVKVPATPAGIPAIQLLIGAGININVTLLFGLEAYESVVQAYLSGLEDRLVAGGSLETVTSVASIFVSRLDSALESRLDHTWLGKVAIANAKVIYAHSRELFAGPRWESLVNAGAKAQRLLWASTSTKSPNLPDLLYVESLIGADTVNTVPPTTYAAFLDHGKVAVALTENMDDARATLVALPAHGVDLDKVCEELLLEGVTKFSDAFRQLLRSVEDAIVPPTVMTYAERPSQSLPKEISAQVDGVIDEWRATGKVERIWAHDASIWTSSHEDSWLGWLNLSLDQSSQNNQFADLIGQVLLEGFTDAVVLGMGGSSLCPDVLAGTFPARVGFPRLHVLDSTDPQQVQSMKDRVDLAHTLFFVSSKSGTTLEPNIFAAYFFERMVEIVGPEKAGSHFIAITDPDSPLQKLAVDLGYRHTYFGVPSIGGRYSALSNFGIVPGAVAGVDVSALFKSSEVLAHTCSPSAPLRENPGVTLGALIGTCAKNGRDKLTIITSPGVAHFGAWLEQLLAESTGKEGLGVIPVDGEPLGAPDVYGSDRLFVYIHLSIDLDNEQEARVSALEKAGHPVLRFEMSDVYQLGREFYRWEFATAVAGSIIGINPFNQPDVEEAKVLARKWTDQYDKTGVLDEQTPFFVGEGLKLFTDATNEAVLASMVGAGADLATYLRAHVARAGVGDYFALLAYVEMKGEHQVVLTQIRKLIRDTQKVATCVGFGPRFQHSTGQAYKGGPNTGVFLQITADDSVELPVPNHRYSFGTAKEIEARSDFQVLAGRGRRVLRIHLGTDVLSGLKQILAALEDSKVT